MVTKLLCVDTKIVNIMKQKKALRLIFPKDKERNAQKLYSLTYFGKLSKHIKKHFRFKNINVSFSTTNTSGKYIKISKSLTDRKKKCGMYEKKCGSCNKVYIGQRGRSFEARMDEHERSYVYTESLITHNTFG